MRRHGLYHDPSRMCKKRQDRCARIAVMEQTLVARDMHLAVFISRIGQARQAGCFEYSTSLNSGILTLSSAKISMVYMDFSGNVRLHT